MARYSLNMALWSRSKKGEMLQPGMHAPAFRLKDVSGAQRSLEEMLANGPVLLSLFKVSCPVCQLTMPYLERMSNNDAVQMVGIIQDDAAAAKKFNAKFGVTFPVLLDEAAEGYPVSNAFGISHVPSLFLVETDGTISKSFEGFSKKDLLEIGQRVQVQPFAEGEQVPEFKPG